MNNRKASDKGGMTLERSYVLKMDNISKEYSGNRVLKGVSLSRCVARGNPCPHGRKRCGQIYADEHFVRHAGDPLHRRL